MDAFELFSFWQHQNVGVSDFINDNHTYQVRALFYRTEQLTFLWILFVFIVVGNGSVLAAIGLSETGNRTRMNFFIMHLAVADLSVGLVNVTTDIAWKTAIEWHGGQVVCKLVRYCQAVVTYASTYVLVALSIDRFDAVAWPMNFTGRVFRARLLISLAWILSLVFSSPMLYTNRVQVDRGNVQCLMEFPKAWHWQLYITLIAAAIFIIPACIIATCYTVIVYVIWTKSGVVEQRSNNTNEFSGNTNMLDLTTVRPIHPSGSSGKPNSRGVIPQAKIRTVKMTLIIVLVFILCWSPYFMFDLLDAYNTFAPSATKTAIATFIQSLAPLNCAVNPIIYGVFSSRICRNLRRVKFNTSAKSCRCCLRDQRRKIRRRFSTGMASWNEQSPATGTSSVTRFSAVPLVQRNMTQHDTVLLMKNVSQGASNNRAELVDSETDFAVPRE